MKTIRRTLGYFKPHIGLFILSILSLTTLTLLGLMRPKLTRILIDDIVIGGEVNLLPWVVAGILAIAILRGFFRFAQGLLSEKVAMRSIADIRRDIFNHLLALPYSYYDKARTGELMSRVSSDVHSLKHLLGNGLIEFYDAILTLTVVLIILIRINWQLTLLSLVTMPILFLVTVKFSYTIRPSYTRIREQMAVLTTTVQENITGIRVVKAFNKQTHEISKFDKENLENKERRIFTANIRALFIPIMQFLAGMSALAVIWFGGRQVILGKLTIGQLVEFYAYIWSLIWPIRRMGFLVNFFERSVAAATRIFEIMDVSPEIVSSQDAIVLDDLGGSIVFDDVSFSYDEGDVLSHINFEVKAGQTVGIIGETGSGKSSLVSLLCRFYDVNDGKVMIDNHDVRDLDITSLRSKIGIVQQDIFLFSASIRENIAFGNGEASDEDIVRAAKIAQAHDFIMEMEEGYESMVGERGIGLSGGQKQRIALARAIVRNPKILILDDATSSVDMETEYAIQRDLNQVLQHRTTLIIAHRISSIKDADTIYVFRHGRIIEQGTHQELVEQGGYYNNIFQDQFRERDLLANYVEVKGVE